MSSDIFESSLPYPCSPLAGALWYLPQGQDDPGWSYPWIKSLLRLVSRRGFLNKKIFVFWIYLHYKNEKNKNNNIWIFGGGGNSARSATMWQHLLSQNQDGLFWAIRLQLLASFHQLSITFCVEYMRLICKNIC